MVPMAMPHFQQKIQDGRSKWPPIAKKRQKTGVLPYNVEVVIKC